MVVICLNRDFGSLGIGVMGGSGLEVGFYDIELVVLFIVIGLLAAGCLVTCH